MQAGEAVNRQTRIYYEQLGDPAGTPLVLISGLGSQLLYWTPPLCECFIDQGFQLIRLDNRDSGLSSKTPGTPPTVGDVLAGALPNPPYTLSDMAADTIAVLDNLQIESAHLVGVSLGGMIAQTLAIEYPQRCRSLTSIMSCAWRRPNMLASDEDNAAVNASMTMDLSRPEDWVDQQLEGYRVISGPHFDADYQRPILEQSFRRCYHPEGWSYQMAASLASGDRRPRLQQLKLPTLVIHGGADNLIPPEAGKETADAIPGSRYLYIEDMGHNLLPPHWAEIVEAISGLARSAD